MELRDKVVLVIGYGVSGMGATSLLVSRGAKPIIFDQNTDLDLTEVRKKLPVDGLPIYIGGIPSEILSTIELAIISPGIPTDDDFVCMIKGKNIPVIGEIELAYMLDRGRVIAITGTNGKTTTTALMGAICKAYYPKVFVVGNIGTPYTQVVTDTSNESITVAEISSFQLETIDTFHPFVSIILNITPDHLNRHYNMENYSNIKSSITRNQNANDYCIVNADDINIESILDRIKSRIVMFSSKRKIKDGYYQDGEWICVEHRGVEERLLNIREMILMGVHNVENVMAAIAASDSIGIPRGITLDAIRCFEGVEHRIEYVTTIDDVDYYNDSKATNPDAAIRGIASMNRPTILIAGGYDKSSDYDEWLNIAKGKIRHIILLGATRYIIAGRARAIGIADISIVEDMSAACTLAKNLAQSGDAVLLSPACASWGMFANFEERGRIYKELVVGRID